MPFLAEMDPSAMGGGFGNILFLVLMMAGFWFLLIAPQRKRQKAHEKMLSALEEGDEVITSGGMYGVISRVKEDRLVIKLAEGVVVEFNKNAVQSKVDLAKNAK